MRTLEEMNEKYEDSGDWLHETFHEMYSECEKSAKARKFQRIYNLCITIAILILLSFHL